jgi:hypothetical protein
VGGQEKAGARGDEAPGSLRDELRASHQSCASLMLYDDTPHVAVDSLRLVGEPPCL